MKIFRICSFVPFVALAMALIFSPARARSQNAARTAKSPDTTGETSKQASAFTPRMAVMNATAAKGKAGS